MITVPTQAEVDEVVRRLMTYHDYTAGKAIEYLHALRAYATQLEGELHESNPE